jgi:hypothetical protein
MRSHQRELLPTPSLEENPPTTPATLESPQFEGTHEVSFHSRETVERQHQVLFALGLSFDPQYRAIE